MNSSPLTFTGLDYEDTVSDHTHYVMWLVGTFEPEQLRASVKDLIDDDDLVTRQAVRLVSPLKLANLIAENTDFSKDDQGWRTFCQDHCVQAPHPSETVEERNGACLSWRSP